MQQYGVSGEELAVGSLQAAVTRLDQACSQLENSRAEYASRQGGQDAFADDRARLAAELDASRSREKALEQLAAEASAALGRASDEVRAALLQEGDLSAHDEGALAAMTEIIEER